MGFDERQFAYLTNRSSTQAKLSLVEIVKADVLQDKVAGVFPSSIQTLLAR